MLQHGIFQLVDDPMKLVDSLQAVEIRNRDLTKGGISLLLFAMPSGEVAAELR